MGVGEIAEAEAQEQHRGVQMPLQILHDRRERVPVLDGEVGEEVLSHPDFPRRHIEHDHAALAVDIVTISETTELLLTSSVPHVELNGTQVLQCLLVETNEWGVGRTERGFGLEWRGIRW